MLTNILELPEGIEPPPRDYKALVLPLNYGSIVVVGEGIEPSSSPYKEEALTNVLTDLVRDQRLEL